MKILLTGNLFFDYEYDIRDALLELGHDVDMLFNNIHGPTSLRDIPTIPAYIKYGVLPHKLKFNYFRDRSVEKYNSTLQHLIRSKQYDLLLVISAKTIFPETIEFFKGPKVLWFLDGISRYDYVQPKLRLFDHLFMFETTDVPLVKEKFGLKAQFLTTAFNPHKYYPLNKDAQRDASFIGAFYPKRDEYLGKLLNVTESVGIYGDFFRSKNRHLKSKILGLRAKYDKANVIYNTSKINVNIHHPQSKEGLSIRTFEILGAGGFQLVERQRVAVSFFEENEAIAYYDTLDEFLDKARFYLNNDQERRRISQNGYQVASRHHTWKARMVELLQTIKN